METTNLASFQSKSFNYTLIILYLQKVSTLTIANFTTSARTEFTLQTSVHFLGPNTMCSTFTPHCRYKHSINKPLGNVLCPNTLCSGLFCVHKKYFQSLGRSDYQCPEGTSTCEERNIHFEVQTIWFDFLKCDQAFILPKRHKNQFKMFLQMCAILDGSVSNKCGYVDTWKENNESRYECLPRKACCHVLNMPFKDQKPRISCLLVMPHIVLSKRRGVTTKTKKHLLFPRNFTANHYQAHPNPSQKRQKSVHLWHNQLDSPLVDTVNQKVFSLLFFNLFRPQ